jgi:hypothetical protein
MLNCLSSEDDDSNIVDRKRELLLARGYLNNRVLAVGRVLWSCWEITGVQCS